jgi:diguanylate cyclase (GGDEF)-like protein/PAS domain S-box-containing protein
MSPALSESTVDQLAVSVMDAMADPVIAVGPDTTLVWGNRAAEERYGAPLATLIGDSLAPLIHPDDLETALVSMVSVLEKTVGAPIELRIRDASGEFSWFELRGRAWAGGPPGSVVLSFREVTDRRRLEISGGDAEMLGAVLEHLPVIAMVLGVDGTVRGANRALTRSLQRDVEAVRDRPVYDLVAPGDVDRLKRELLGAARQAGTTQLEARLVRAEGGEVPMTLSVVNLLDDRAVRGLLVTAADITSLALARRELYRRASTDDLTGLPNRGSLRAHLESVLEGGPDHAVLFIDVDGLKAVNDGFGHRAGDTVLCAVARRLKAVTFDRDLVARLSGDEFVVVVAGGAEANVATVVDRIEQVMREPVVLIDGRRVPVAVSVGVTEVSPSLSADDLLAAADAAMYVSKRDRRT